MLRHFSEYVGICVKRVHHIATQVLGYRKTAAVWVPKSLNDEHKATCVSICWESLLTCERQGDVGTNRIVRWDESWCLQYDLDTKCMSQQRKHPLSPRPKQSRAVPSVCKVMLTMFFDLLRPLLIDCLPKGINANADCRDETPEHLK
jgi:hypothetical protein